MDAFKNLLKVTAIQKNVPIYTHRMYLNFWLKYQRLRDPLKSIRRMQDSKKKKKKPALRAPTIQVNDRIS